MDAGGTSRACTACCQTRTNSSFGAGEWVSFSPAGICSSPFVAFLPSHSQISSILCLEGIGTPKYAKLKDCCFPKCHSSFYKQQKGKRILWSANTYCILFPSQFLCLPKINIVLIQTLLTHMTVWVHWSPASFASKTFIQFLFAYFYMTENIHL